MKLPVRCIGTFLYLLKMKDKEGGVIVDDKVGNFCQELIAKCMWWIKLRMVASEDLTSKEDLTNKALHNVL